MDLTDLTNATFGKATLRRLAAKCREPIEARALAYAADRIEELERLLASRTRGAEGGEMTCAKHVKQQDDSPLCLDCGRGEDEHAPREAVDPRNGELYREAKEIAAGYPEDDPDRDLLLRLADALEQAAWAQATIETEATVERDAARRQLADATAELERLHAVLTAPLPLDAGTGGFTTPHDLALASAREALLTAKLERVREEVTRERDEIRAQLAALRKRVESGVRPKYLARAILGAGKGEK